MRWLSRRPSPAMAVALGALIMSVGGNVAAGVLITSADIKDNTIRSVDVRDEALKSADIDNGSLTGADVKNGTLTGADVDESTLTRVPSAERAVKSRSAANAQLLDGQEASDFVADGESAGGDMSGAFSNLQITRGAVGREELASGTSPGCCVGSFFKFTVPANACHTRAESFPEADLGEILIVRPEGDDLGAGVYLRPTVVAHRGEILIETCNSTGAPVVIPFGTFFTFRLIG